MKYSAAGAIRLDCVEDEQERGLEIGSGVVVEAAKRFSASMEEYIFECEASVGKRIDPRIARYLRSLATFFPPSLVIVAQEPYTEHLLPAFASAFAFDPTRLEGFTPSVQVLAQYLAAVGNVGTLSIANLLACSYVLAPHGIFCVNALIWKHLAQCPRRRTLSLFSHLISQLLEHAGASGAARVDLVCLGEVASSAVRPAVKSTPRQRLQGLRVLLTSLANPVFIARSRSVLAQHKDRLPDESCLDVHARHRALVETVQTVTTQSVQTWNQYSRYAVLLLGSPGPLREAFNWTAHNDLRILGQQSVSALALLRRDANIVMSKPRDDADKLSATHAHVHRTMNSLLSSGMTVEREVLKAVQRVCEQADRLSPVDSESVASFKRYMQDLTNSFSAALAFYASINPALTACSSAVDLVGPSVPPIVRTRPLDDVALQPVSFADALGDLDHSETPAYVNVEEKESAEHYEPDQDPEDVAPSEFSAMTSLQSVETPEPQPAEPANPPSSKRSYVIALPKRR